ncbi:MAG: transglycosylase domain-containing protein, partial [bacterium]|nr:transglycosylase domain-containing protein [bacterium]
MRLPRSISTSRLMVKLATAALGVVIVGTVAMVGLFAYYAKDLPAPDKVVRREGFATKIYDRNGKLLYDLFEGERRTLVSFDDVPLILRQATIAIEDKNFYKHGGFDIWGIARGLFRTLFLGRTQGGSTITQQLVKNVLLTQQRTITRKLKEFILTIQVERRYSKDQILQMYLNEAPYGGTAWGVQSASETYFGKPVSEISLAQAAMLAGLPQSPSRYSPSAGDLYVSRAKEVLRRMREDGYISREEELTAADQVSHFTLATPSGLLKAPHFVFYVRQQLEERYGEHVVEQGGLKVTTTLDLDLQEKAQGAVSEEIEKVKSLKITNGGAVAIDSTTGQILVMVGSRGWEDPDYDGKFNVTTALRQPGSSIKPIVYLTGLQKGYTAATLLMDTKTIFPGGDKPEYIPENYDGKFRGPILVREALGNSINVPAVKMLSLVGISDMMQTAYEMGLTTLQPTKENLARVGLSVALGGGEVKLLEMGSAYSAFANGGKRMPLVSILKVVNNDGQVLEEWKPPAPRQVIKPQEAFIISSILSDPKAREITFGPRSAINVAGHTIAVKTGTTNDRRDNWTIGWTANGPVVGVWVGNNDNSPMKEVASGVTGAAPIWRRIILAALAGKSDAPFTPSDGVGSLDIDTVSGFPAHDSFAAKQEFFIRGTEPSGADSIHKLVRDCNGEQKEYFYFKESDPFEKNGLNQWQAGIDAWLATQGDSKYHPPTGDGCNQSSQLWVTVAEPG